MVGDRMFREGQPPEYLEALRRAREQHQGRPRRLWAWALGAFVLGGLMAAGAFALAGF